MNHALPYSRIIYEGRNSMDKEKNIIAKKLDVEQIEEFLNRQMEIKKNAEKPG